MTKPIEGWVIINNDNNGEANRYTSEHVGGDYIEVFTSEEGALDVSGDGETVRSVKITFTDEAQEEADAIRKERERIWKAAWEVWPNWYPDLRTILFGEDK